MAVFRITAPHLPHSKFIAVRFSDNSRACGSKELDNRRVVWGGKFWPEIRTGSEERRNPERTFEHGGRTRRRHVGGTYIILHRDSHVR